MRILLVSATVAEIRPILNHFTETEARGEVITTYRFLDHQIDLLIPGVGMLVTAYHMGRQLSKETYNIAINAGIAGSFRKEIPIGSVVEVVEDMVCEFGAEAGDSMISAFDLGLVDPDSFPFRGGRLINDRRISLPALDRLPKVKGSTVNKLHETREGIERVKKFTKAEIETMEGAAFLYACLSAGVPNILIRAVSNYVEERDKSRWNIPLALKNLDKVLQAGLREFSTYQPKKRV